MTQVNVHVYYVYVIELYALLCGYDTDRSISVQQLNANIEQKRAIKFFVAISIS